jgi:hypothetical protein
VEISLGHHRCEIGNRSFPAAAAAQAFEDFYPTRRFSLWLSPLSFSRDFLDYVQDLTLTFCNLERFPFKAMLLSRPRATYLLVYVQS